jgi:flagellar basal body-associated protein FliL
MPVKSKKILVIIIMVVLVSSVVAGAASLFNRSGNSDVSALNARINEAVNSCMQSLPTGAPTCDTQLASVIYKICSPQNNNEQQRSQIDACHDGKVVQYYKIRNAEIAKTRDTIIRNNNTMQK